jgi:hypothetical protein
MNAYFMKITPEDRENILDKHKHVYDGYVTNYVKPGVSELYTQDFANDKNGITVNNKGNVTHYKNMNINESECSECGMTEEKMCSECGFTEGLCECGMNEEVGDFPKYQSFDYVEDLDLDQKQEEDLKEEVTKMTEMFNRVKNYN